MRSGKGTEGEGSNCRGPESHISCDTGKRLGDTNSLWLATLQGSRKDHRSLMRDKAYGAGNDQLTNQILSWESEHSKEKEVRDILGVAHENHC